MQQDIFDKSASRPGAQALPADKLPMVWQNLVSAIDRIDSLAGQHSASEGRLQALQALTMALARQNMTSNRLVFEMCETLCVANLGLNGLEELALQEAPTRAPAKALLDAIDEALEAMLRFC